MQPTSAATPAQNHLIELLPARERGRLLALCEPVHLVLSEALQEAGAAAQHVYFPTEGFISLVSRVDEHPGLEVGMVGREGMVGTPLVLGVARVPARALVQGAGASWRIEAAAFTEELQASAALRQQLARYVYVLMAQAVSSAGCLRFHHVGQRLARWLLMSQDRAHRTQFHVTHEFLAYMLGVRRVGVTVAAGELQRRGLIQYQRGELTVTDRPGLEAAACSCYAADRAVYADQLGGAAGPAAPRAASSVRAGT
ncbi:Crp/Fnr family transcriptional regulator [beta proteobacterium AAP121]|nr:Crp/Fnr family transcriptional regulator [beta proteobacterium AAP65]KPF91362.1 Crp/Fnr family transcriptional regulator [beta proteobacterium AAP121]